MRKGLEISKKSKVFFPDSNITKGELVEYYMKIAHVILPYLKNRPITMHRFPDGIEGKNFYQKDTPEYFPEWIETAAVKKKNGTVTHVICNNTDTLAYIANQACITPHTWLSRTSDLNKPDKMVFDLDPSDNDTEKVKNAAFTLKKLLEVEGFSPCIMTSGSRGFHIVVFLIPGADFEKTRKYAQHIAQKAVTASPESFTVEQRKNKRGSRVFIDINRNAYAQTSVTPYSVRARKSAPVAVPIEWHEASNPSMTPDRYNIRNIFRRLEHKEDPWKNTKSFTLP